MKKVVSVPAPEKKAFVSRPVVVQPKKMYHIVIASFPSESQADEFIAGVDRNECKHVSKVVRDGKYRIYADKFDNREAAESYMATLRSNPKYKDAWLFISPSRLFTKYWMTTWRIPWRVCPVWVRCPFRVPPSVRSMYIATPINWMPTTFL